jgi:hypothetical protein
LSWLLWFMSFISLAKFQVSSFNSQDSRPTIRV